MIFLRSAILSVSHSCIADTQVSDHTHKDLAALGALGNVQKKTYLQAFNVQAVHYIGIVRGISGQDRRYSNAQCTFVLEREQVQVPHHDSGSKLIQCPSRNPVQGLGPFGGAIDFPLINVLHQSTC